MNKTLLLIIIDFLFLNLIALTRWEKVEPARTQQPPVSQMGANAATKDQDLVATMRQSLADETATRQALEQRLAQAGSDLTERQQGLAQLQAQREQLAAQLRQSEQTAQQLAETAQAARRESSLTQDQLTQLERELEERRAETERQRRELARMESEQQRAQQIISGLTTQVAVGETERQNLQQEAAQLQSQVAQEREDRLKVEASTTQLAQGVGQLARNSGALTQEIRENRPINENVLFNDFLANRVETLFAAARQGVFHEVTREKQTPTVLVSDGHQVYALLHIDDTPFSDLQQNYDWDGISVTFTHPPDYRTSGSELDFLNVDPRVVAIPLTDAQVAALGAKVYSLATDPFKFPDAVLINGARGYGVLSFKLDPSNPGYVRVDNRFFKRLFGGADMRPAPGDLVFSRTGELLGIMVNHDYCALLKDFSPMVVLKTGNDTLPEHPAALLNQVAARIQSMPLDLQ